MNNIKSILEKLICPVFICVIYIIIVLIGNHINNHLNAGELIKGTESQYQKYLNNRVFNGQIEVVLDDKTRIDIFVKDKYAIEVDFATKWYEAIGQASHYAVKTNTPPAICLIVRNNNDMEKVTRAQFACSKMYILIGDKLARYSVFYVDDRDGFVSKNFNEDTLE